LSAQLQFAVNLEKRRQDPAPAFRQHLRGIHGAIEE
jgi:hypothetical protein